MPSPLLNSTIAALAEEEIEVSERGVRAATDDPADEAKRAYLLANKAVKAILGSVIDSAIVRAPRLRRHAVEAVRADLGALPDIVDEATAERALEGLEEIMAITFGTKGLAAISAAVRSCFQLVRAATAFEAAAQSAGSARGGFRGRPSATAFARDFSLLAAAAINAVPDEGEAQRIVGVIQSGIDAAAASTLGGVPDTSAVLGIFSEGLGLIVFLAGTGSLATREAARARSLASFALNTMAAEAARLGGLDGSTLRLKGNAVGHDPAVLADSVKRAEALLASVPRGEKQAPLRDTLEAAIAAGKEALSTARPAMSARAAARQSALAVRYAILAGVDEGEAQDLSQEAVLDAMGAG